MLGAGLPPLARTNALSSAIEVLPDTVSATELAERILALAKSADEIDADVVFVQINEDRAVAQFPLITDITIIEDEMRADGANTETAVKDLLNRQPTSTILSGNEFSSQTGNESWGKSRPHDLSRNSSIAMKSRPKHLPR